MKVYTRNTAISGAVIWGLKRARKVLQKVWPEIERASLPPFDCEGQAANSLIRERLLSGEPCMISRFGNTEMKVILRYRRWKARSIFAQSWRFLRGREGPFWWDDDIRWEMQHSSGYFPCTNAALEKFSARYIRDLAQMDILGSWLTGEADLHGYLAHATRVPLPDLEPYFHKEPWSAVLEGQKVLVIHPFEESIRRQYEKRSSLFADQRILPDFELKTFKAVQSLGGTGGGFATWFDALDWMATQIGKIDFDVALIGAGAYGLPLAAFIKSLGRKAIHLGGATQLMFGIRGTRWDNRPMFQGLYNEHWVRPLPEEKPATWEVVGATRRGGAGDRSYW